MSTPPDDKPTISLAQAKRAVTKALGPNGRLWRNEGGGWSMGVDKKPGRLVLCTGPDLWFCLFGRYDPPTQSQAGQASTNVVNNGPGNEVPAEPVAESVLPTNVEIQPKES